LTLDYKQIQPLEYLLKKLDGRIVAQDFAGQVKVQVQVPAGQVAVLLAAFAGDGREAVYVAGSG
jgi:putative IMPACT (imprinted ancient) family translation regulator